MLKDHFGWTLAGPQSQSAYDAFSLEVFAAAHVPEPAILGPSATVLFALAARRRRLINL